MWGGSVFGHTQWSIADQTNPDIDAFFVQIASTDFREMFFPGNAFSLESTLYWAIRSRGETDRDVSFDDLERGVSGFPIIKADDRAIGDTNFFNDWLLNKNQDSYWEKIDGNNRIESLRAPMLLMAGWFDPFLPTQLNGFSEIITKANIEVANESRLIIGPWGHAVSVNFPGTKQEIPYRKARISPSIPWFDYQLGISSAPLNMPRVEFNVMGVNKWRNENEWPLARTLYTPFYIHSDGIANSLHGDGTLNTKPPAAIEPVDKFVYNPVKLVPTAGGAMLGDRSGVHLQNDIETRMDVLVYTSEALTKPVEVAGPIKTILYVSTDAISTDFTVKLVDVCPDGSAYNVTDGILRRKYLKKDSPTKIEIELWPSSIVFLKKHKLRLEISSSNFPRYDRNPNTGRVFSTATEMKIANQTIYHSQQYPSYITLPLISSSR